MMARKVKCDVCGNKVSEDEAYYGIARVDPYTKIARKPTEEEIGSKPEDFREARRLGYFFATLCPTCNEEWDK
jgi:hypothetical protein